MAELTRRWRRWTAVVELFARRRRARRRVDPTAYERLHRELLGACRSLAGAADEGRRQCSRRLEELAGPWVSPEALERSDREACIDLLAQCRRAEREFGVRPRAWPRALSLARLLTLAAGLAVAALWLAPSAWAWLLDGFRAAWSAARSADDAQRALAVGAVVAAAAAFLVWRAARD
jgi:hypothetical protein